MQGLDTAQVCLFSSFSYQNTKYPCTLIDWYDCVADALDEGVWIIKPVMGSSTIVHLDMMLHCAHLIPVFGPTYVNHLLKPTFNDADYHMHEIVFFKLFVCT